MDWFSSAAADWGNVPGWIAVGISAIGSIIAICISRKAKNAAERSATAAEKSAANGARSAGTAAEALQLQQQAATPKVDLRIHQAGRSVYRLQNDGDAPAQALDLHPDDDVRLQWENDQRPTGLAPGASADFFAASPANKPSSLRIKWAGRADYAHVPMP